MALSISALLLLLRAGTGTSDFPPLAAPRGVCDVFTDCGARPPPFLSSDALTACARTCRVLSFPENSTLLVSSVDISNTTGLTLLFGAGAIVNATTNISAYPIAPFFPPMGRTTCYRAVFFGRNVTDFQLIASASAVIDGGGAFWQPLRATLPHQAPKLFELVDARNVSVTGGTFSSSANWHIHLVFSTDVTCKFGAAAPARAPQKKTAPLKHPLPQRTPEQTHHSHQRARPRQPLVGRNGRH